MDKNKLAILVNETMDAMDGAERATPAPFLLTRLQGALQREETSFWERIILFICRPGVAVAAVLLVVVLNFFMYTYDRMETVGGQTMNSAAEEYSMINPAALFDIENTQP